MRCKAAVVRPRIAACRAIRRHHPERPDLRLTLATSVAKPSTCSSTERRSLGLDAAEQAALDRGAVYLTTLPGPYLGLAAPGAAWINVTAAGLPWFLDPSPAADALFAAGLAHLKRLTALQALNLEHCYRVTDAGLAYLRKYLPQCRIAHSLDRRDGGRR